MSVPQAAEEAKAAPAEPAAQASEGEAAVENGADASVPAEGAAQTELSVPVTEEPEPIASEPEAVEPPAQADVPVVSADAKSEEKHEPQVNGDSMPPAPESDAKDELVEAEAEKEKEDESLYVGDATWEERTYKELVRLREEMFWARVGAVVH